MACQAALGASAGSAQLLDFNDQAQFGQIKLSAGVKLEPAPESYEGKGAAKIVFGAVPAGVRDYPAAIIEGPALKVRDFSPFEAMSLWVRNPAAQDAELSFSVWDKDGNRSFPIPSTVTIKPGDWQQIVTRLVLQGLDAKRIGSVHFFQKSNRRPVTLLIADVELLSPFAGRFAGRIQATRQALNTARINATAMGADDQIEPKIAALTHALEQVEKSAGSANSTSDMTRRLMDLAQISADAQGLAKAIQISNGGKKLVLAGPLLEAGWLKKTDSLKFVTELTLSNTSLGDEIFSLLAPAANLDSLTLDSRKITGAGLDQLTCKNLHSLTLTSAGVTDDSLKGLQKFRALQNIHLDRTSVSGGVFQTLAGLNQLKTLSLAGAPVTDAGLAAIGKLASLESLDLKRTAIHGKGLSALAGLTKLKNLDLGDTQLDDSDVAQIPKWPQLESLSLENVPITGAAFGKLSGLTKLNNLDLARTRIGDPALQQLGKLPRLVEIDLSSTRISDGGLTQILESSPLDFLDLFGTNVTDASLAYLPKKHALHALFLAGTQTTDVGLSHIQTLTENLAHLDLEGTQITDAGLQYLQKLHIYSLKLDKTRLTGEGLKYLAGIGTLRRLDLSGTSVTDESLAALAGLKDLRTLDLSGSRVTSEGMRQLRAASQLTELRLEATQVGDQGLEQLASLQNLHLLNLNETAVTNEGLKSLKGMGRLTDLSLSRTRITDDGLRELTDKYVELDLSHTRVTNQGIEHLQRCGQLSKLQLASTDITDDALELLRALGGLTQLDLAGTAVDDAGLPPLAALPQMRDLNLNGTLVSDRGVDAILKLSSLQHLSLEGSRVSAQGLSYLRHNAPKLAVDLVTPFVWGERWSYYAMATPANTQNQPQTAGESIQQLNDLPSLRYLRVNEAMLTPEFLRSLKDLPRLEYVSFQHTTIADDMLSELLGLSQVARLDFSGTRLTDKGLEHLKDMQGLRELNLAGTQVTGAGFVDLANLKQLQTLNLRDTPLDDAGVSHLVGLKELRRLELSDTRLTDAAMDSLAQLPRLQYLDLYGVAVTDRGLASLSRQTGLRYCYLTNARVTDAGIEHLRGLSELEELALDGTQLTDRGLASLTSLTNLSSLRISGTKVTAAGLSELLQMPRIERLELAGLPVTDAALQGLAPLSGLKSLDVSGTPIDDFALPTLGAFPLLTKLNVRDTAITASAIARFQQAHPGVNVIAGSSAARYSIWGIAIAGFYLLAACLICLFGLHRYWLSWRLLRAPEARRSPEPLGQFTQLPKVTVQLPMYNERQVAQRIIEAACALDYPCELLQIQVLDDSNDSSANAVRRCCERMAARGHPIQLLHRDGREGFKSGALAQGLQTASGEFVAIFDADFLPAPDFLRQTISHFTDAKIGVVQAEWSHLNRADSWLTELQAMFLDGHFVVEQTVRSHCGRWFNFNGTAGVWRRSCIDDAGGWQNNTLTEDTDLSYRAQLKGWKFLYLPTVHCQGELPATMTAFLGQQHRWTKGLIQSAKKLLPRILLSNAPLKIKLEACFHLTTPVMYLIMFLVTAIALPAIFLKTPFDDRAAAALAVGLGTLLLGTFGAATFYAVSQRVQGFSLAKALLKIPFLMALGVGICVVNARAVVEALLGFRSPFVRTPKFGGRGDYDTGEMASHRPLRFPGGLTELLIAGVLFACLGLSFVRPFTLIGAPFLLLFALGYSGVGLLRWMDHYAARAPRIRPVAAAPWQRFSLARLATGTVGALLLAAVALAAMGLASPPRAVQVAPQPMSLGIDLTAAKWQPVKTFQAGIPSTGAIKRLGAERGSLVLGIELNEKAREGAIALDLNGALAPLGDSLAGNRQLAFNVEYSPWFTGEMQAFVEDRNGHSEYGSMHIVESHDVQRPVTVALVADLHCPAMGYQDSGFDPRAGIRRLGFKISAQSDRVRGAGYRPFRGTIRIAGVQIADVDPAKLPQPQVLPPLHQPAPLPKLTPAQFLAASGVDRPWPIGYAFSGPITPAHVAELERTYSQIAAQGCRFTRIYLGDYRTGLIFDSHGTITGVEPEFLDFADQLAAVANRHGITVMFSLTDNAMVNGGRIQGIELVREGVASDAFVNNALAAFVKKLKGRQVIWDIFNEPENVTSAPLREVQKYVDRVLAAGRRADPQARFTVVSRSRPEIVYWQGRGLDLYSHNIFTPQSLGESLAAPRSLDAPIMVAEMAPELATGKNLDALREAGYAGVGIWGWGTRDKYQWGESDLDRIVGPLLANQPPRNEQE